MLLRPTRLLPVVTGVAFAACVGVPGVRLAEGSIERLVVAMGTSLQVEVEATGRGQALAASESAIRAVEAVEARLSTWRDDSELARWHDRAATDPATVSPELFADLRRAVHFAEATDGAFDPTVGTLVATYDLRGAGRWPASGELADALAHRGIAKLAWSTDGVGRGDPGMRIEEGGFGKGAALDEAVDVLRAERVRSAVLDFGGQVSVFGKRHAVAIADPRDRSRAVVEIAIDRGSLATTGNSERRRVVDGRALPHVIDPRTGLPAADFGSITVWAKTAFAADCLSTALFVMGPERALRWAERHDDVEVLVLEVVALHGASTTQIVGRATAGMRQWLKPLASDWKLQ